MIFQGIENEGVKFGHWMNKNVFSPIENKFKPIFNETVRIVTTPFKTIDNISTGVEKMSEAWKDRAKSFTNDVITDVDKTAGGLSSFLSTPFYPLIAGLGFLYVLKK